MTVSAAWGCLALIGMSLYMIFFRKLKQEDPDEWITLGSPNPYLPSDVRLSWSTTMYILRGGFEHLPKKNLVWLGRLLRYYVWAYLLLFSAFVIFFIYSMVR